MSVWPGYSAFLLVKNPMVYNTPAGKQGTSPRVRIMKKQIGIALMLTVTALGFRLCLALTLQHDDDDDGRYYSQIARNLLNHHGYSGEEEEPFLPTLVRVPGYPLFLAGVYWAFGQGNDRAVRIIQSALDTVTCWLVALLALSWAPGDWDAGRRKRVMLVALALAAFCPFTAIYVTTILTETCALMLATACVLAATLASKSQTRRLAWWLWTAAGMLGALAVMFRPDCGFLVAGAGMALMFEGLGRYLRLTREGAGPAKRRVVLLAATKRAIILSLSFAAVLAPWTLRNARVFGVFQPVAPLYANNPDEKPPVGYIAWLRTWVDDERYVLALEDGLDLYPLSADSAPDWAFDSPEERTRVVALYERYNHYSGAAADEETVGGSGTAEDDQTSGNASAGGTDENGEQFVKMTPELDAEFGEIARERIARNPFRYFVGLPVRRAVSLWFDTHSQFYAFEGRLFPWSDLDTEAHQQYWLPAFMLLLWMYTLAAVAGGWIMWRGERTRRWLLLLALLIVPRLAFLSFQEHPEGRYTVEFFPLVAAAAGLAGASPLTRMLRARTGDCARSPGSGE